MGSSCVQKKWGQACNPAILARYFSSTRLFANASLESISRFCFAASNLRLTVDASRATMPDSGHMIKPTLNLDPQLPRHTRESYLQKPEYPNIAGSPLSLYRLL